MAAAVRLSCAFKSQFLCRRCVVVPGPDWAHILKASQTPAPQPITHQTPLDFTARVTSCHSASLQKWDLAELPKLGSWNITNSYNFLLSAGCSYQICSWNHYLVLLHAILEAICGKHIFTKVTKQLSRGLFESKQCQLHLQRAFVCQKMLKLWRRGWNAGALQEWENIARASGKMIDKIYLRSKSGVMFHSCVVLCLSPTQFKY